MKTLREIRSESGKTLREVEQLSGISNAYLSQLETGKIKNPSAQSVLKLSTVYNVSFNDIMKALNYAGECTSSVNQLLRYAEHLTEEQVEELIEALRFRFNRNSIKERSMTLTEKLRQQLPSFEAACGILNVPADTAVPSFEFFPERDRVAMQKFSELLIIIRAANWIANDGKDWVPDCSNTDEKAGRTAHRKPWSALNLSSTHTIIGIRLRASALAFAS